MCGLGKSYDWVLSEKLWYCMKKSGVAEMYMRAMQDMYDNSMIVVSCVIGMMDGFKMEVGQHQGLALSQFMTTSSDFG